MQGNSRKHCSLGIDKGKEKEHEVQRNITQMEVTNGSLKHQKGQKSFSSPRLTKQQQDGTKPRSVNPPWVMPRTKVRD